MVFQGRETQADVVPVWVPNPGGQDAFLRCPFFEALLDGPRGSAKTDALLMDYARDVNKGYGEAWRGIIFRQTFPQLADIVARSKRWFPRIFPGSKFVASGFSGYRWTFPGGETLMFRYCSSADDYWNYHGWEVPWIGWEELCNWATPDCYEVMKSICRSSHPNIPKRYRAVTNSFGPGHSWVKARFVDPAPLGEPIVDETGRVRYRIYASAKDNPHLLRNDPDYIERLKQISDPEKRKAWILGSWDITSGGIFAGTWDADVHCIDPFNIPESWRIDRSFDWGWSKPFSVAWWAESNGEQAPDGRAYPSGTLFRIAEWYGCSDGDNNKGLMLETEKIAEGILDREAAMGLADRVEPGPADNSIFDATDSPSIASRMEDAGVEWTRSNKSPGSRVIGCTLFRDMLNEAKKPIPEGPAFYVFNTCRQFIAIVPFLDRAKRNPEDVETTGPDHIWDETRYRILDPKTEIYAG